MIFGQGSPHTTLDEKQIRVICEKACYSLNFHGKRVLVILPDHTRSGPVGMMFRIIYSLIAPEANILDFIIALGTHPPLSDEQIFRLVGITRYDYVNTFSKARFFNHNSKDSRMLKHVVTFAEDEIEAISGGLLRTSVPVTINSMIYEYDILLIVGTTFPQEALGFSGGHKYLFPGISGEEITSAFHWIAALITIPVFIGTQDTPMRALVEKAASFIPIERVCFNLVVRDKDVFGLFIGPPDETFRAAASLSEKIHIIYADKPFHRVLACAPLMYDEMWTAGKCMYKHESVVADGGELIIYAPHINRLSLSHGSVIETIGYHVRDYYVSQWDTFKHFPWLILAHSTKVKGIGTYECGVEHPRITVKLATQFPEEYCKHINLGYTNPDKIDFRERANREEEGVLYVPKAGEMLYLLKNNPFR